MSKIYAIGDIHGRFDLLKDLLTLINSTREEGDTIVFLGDYVDRGPQSRDVVAYLRGLKTMDKNVVVLKGNHEVMMVEGMRNQHNVSGFDMWFNHGGRETLISYTPKGGFAPDVPDAHLDFLDNLPIKYREGKYFFCHAGVNPNRNLNKQTEETMLWGRMTSGYKGQFLNHKHQPCKDVVVYGHTPNDKFIEVAPYSINVDTNSCWSGVLGCAVLHHGGKEPDFLFAGEGYVKYLI